MKISESAYFVTLTYDYNHVPITKKGVLTLDKKDLQKFFKRLRITRKRAKTNYTIEGLTGKKKIKYYAVGEYGDLKERPHYHAVIFNAARPEIETSWGLGAIDIQPVTNRAIRYVLGYVEKKLFKEKKMKGLREKEFSVMSKGIGDNYLTPGAIEVHRHPEMNYTILEGYKIALPKYYQDRIHTEESKKELIKYIKKTMKEEKDKEMTLWGDRYPDRIRQQQRAKDLKRNINLQKQRDF